MSEVEGVKDRVEQLSVKSGPGGSIDRVPLVLGAKEPTYEVEARRAYQEALFLPIPPRHDVLTLDVPEHAKKLLTAAGVQIVNRERPVHIPQLPLLSGEGANEDGSHIDKQQILQRVRGEASDTPNAAIIDGTFLDAVITFDQYAHGWSGYDRFGDKHYGLSQADREKILQRFDGMIPENEAPEQSDADEHEIDSRENFRMKLSAEDRALYERVTRENNQLRKQKIATVATTLTAVADAFERLEIKPDVAAHLDAVGKQIIYIFHGDKDRNIKEYMEMNDDEKLALVRMCVDASVLGLQLMLGSDPQQPEQAISTTFVT